MSIVYTISNQKGGCGKTTLTLNLGVSLTRMGYRVCIIDLDPQANATMALGHSQPDELPVTVAEIMEAILKPDFKIEKSELIQNREYILHSQGVDFIPSNIRLADVESRLLNAISRESALKKLVRHIRGDYDFVLIDTMPSLNFVTVNGLNAADKVLIPTQPQYFSAKGLELLFATIGQVREELNPTLEIAVITGKLKKTTEENSSQEQNPKMENEKGYLLTNAYNQRLKFAQDFSMGLKSGL